MVKYAPLEGCGWQQLPEFLAKKEAIINILNNEERCYGYSILYFLERAILSERNSNCSRVSLYKKEMFIRYHLDMLPYPISPNDVHQYQDQLQMNSNLFSFYDDVGRVRHLIVISRKNYERVANLFYWKELYEPITNIHQLFKDITKHKQQLQFCLRCLCHFSSEEVLARNQKLCTRNDFMSMLHVRPVPGSNHAQIKFNQYKYCTKALFVIYADFESILEPSVFQVKHITYTQQYKVCAA